jgi:hypothetical protein
VSAADLRLFWSRDGQLFVTFGKTITGWHTSTWQQAWQVPVSRCPFPLQTLAPERTTLTVGRTYGSLTPRSSPLLSLHQIDPLCQDWFAESETLINCFLARDKPVWVEKSRTILLPVDAIAEVIWSGCLHRVLTFGSLYKSVCLWKCEDQQLLWKTDRSGWRKEYNVFTPDDRILLQCWQERVSARLTEICCVLRRTDDGQEVARLQWRSGALSLFPPVFHPSKPWFVTVGSSAREVRLWKLNYRKLLRHAPVATRTAEVLLLGRRGSGRSALGQALVGQPFSSLVVAQHRWTMRQGWAENYGAPVRETLQLWETAEVSQKRVLECLSRPTLAVVLLICDKSQVPDPWEDLLDWSAVLDEARRHRSSHDHPLLSFLVMTRCDLGGLMLSPVELFRQVRWLGAGGHFQTSAKTGQHIQELRTALEAVIDWSRLPIDLEGEIDGA